MILLNLSGTNVVIRNYQEVSEVDNLFELAAVRLLAQC